MPMTLNAALARATADGVITKAELRELAELDEAKNDPADLAAKLDTFAKKMSTSGADIFSAFRATASIQGSGIPALDILSGKRSAPAKLPEWYPANFDLARAAAQAKEILIGQRESPDSIGPGKADKIVFTDADLTLLQTTTPTFLRHKETGEILTYPDTGRIVYFGMDEERNAKKDLDAIKARYPEIAWDKYASDYSEFGSLAEVLRTPAIADDLRTLRRSDRDPKSRDFVITARSAEITHHIMNEYLTLHGVDINGTFAVNSPSVGEKLGLGALSSARRKAVVMAAILEAYGPESIKSAKFLDDGDDNLIAAMQLLPKLYPHIRFSFCDVINDDGTVKYRHRLLARSTPWGELVDAKNRPFSVEKIDTYKSQDRYPIDPTFEPRPRRTPAPA